MVPSQPLGHLERTSFATAPTSGDLPAQVIPPKVMAAIVAGNAFEFYDFVAYAFFAVYIGRAFFPTQTPFVSLLLSVGVFGVGFVSRPLGGVLIGAYADRAGRKPAMLLTITLITVSTPGLVFVPSYASIGSTAPLIVVCCRLVQGLALGGEVGPTSAFLVEAAPPDQRGVYASWQIASQGLAVLVAGGFGMALSLLLSPGDLAAWGWRIPFLLCLALLSVAVWLRRAMPETLWGEAVAAKQRTRPLRRTSAWDPRRLLALAVLAIMGGAVSTYLGIYMTTYALATLHLTPFTALAATVVGGLSTLVFALAGGRLSDCYGRRPVMLIPRILLALLVYPLFLLIAARPGAPTLLLATAIIAALTAASGAASLAAISELLPGQIRATGLAIAYAIGASLFGGTTQFVITAMIEATGNPTSPAWYVAATSIVIAVAMWVMPESRFRALEN